MSIAYDRPVSPAPARTSNDAIVAAARQILEVDGLEAVTMRAVADAVGVRGPSLYKRVPDRAALLRAVADRVIHDLARAMSRAVETGDPRRDVTAAVHAFRRFVRSSPGGYRLLFADLPTDALPDADRLAALGEPIVIAMSKLVGNEHALEAARTVVAWAHGFVTMELAGAFRLGGELDAAYAFGIASILRGIEGGDVNEAASPA
jgi:AcrR family transcriptional regulator